jgi:hypothetical protein
MTGLAAGTTYSFKVAAKNINGTSPLTSPISILTFPNPPSAITVDTALTKLNQVTFSWTAPIINGGSPITGYQISWDQGIGSWVVYNSAYTSTSLIVSGLNAGKTYSFKLASINSAGTSALSSVLEILLDIAPNPPTAITIDTALT